MRDLPVGRPDQTERGVPLLAPGRRQPGGGADQDEDREQERDRADDERVPEVAASRPACPVPFAILVTSVVAGPRRQLRRACSPRRSPARPGRSAPAGRSCRPACRGTGRPARRPARSGSARPGPARRSTAPLAGSSGDARRHRRAGPEAPPHPAARWSGPGRCRCCSSTARHCAGDGSRGQRLALGGLPRTAGCWWS